MNYSLLRIFFIKTSLLSYIWANSTIPTVAGSSMTTNEEYLTYLNSLIILDRHEGYFSPNENPESAENFHILASSFAKYYTDHRILATIPITVQPLM
jgi:hypothetical protein